MNIAQLLGFLRIALGAFGGAEALAPLLHTTPDAINGVVNAATPGNAVVGGVAILGALAWSAATHTVAATVDRAVKMDVDATATKAAFVKPNAVRQALATVESAPSQTMKPSGLSRMVDK